MSVRISAQHPIRELFQTLVHRSFQRQLRPADPQVTRYIADVMVDFTHRDNIYRIRNARGKHLEEVAEMLMEGDVTLNASSFEREREVHKHIGDFTLFWTGVYPEMLRYFRASTRSDHLLDYVEQGRASYRIAATFEHGPYADEAPVLRQLAGSFEQCMLGLNMVRRELDAYAAPETQAVRKLLES